MQLTDLSPAQLARLADRARDELDRRQARKPVSAVREQLERVAADEGYTLADVFPEFVDSSAPAPAASDTSSTHVPDAIAPAHAAPQLAQPQPSKPAAAALQTPATPRTVAASTAPAPSAPADPAQIVVNAAARIAASRPGMPILLAQLRDAAGMQSDWPAFHAALEQAVRRGWLYFAGNDACVLTADGETNAATPSD